MMGAEEAAMPADSITARYLAELDHPIFPFPENYSAEIRFAGRYLSRPVFLEAEEFSRLERDLSLVLSALSTLPHRVYDGDLRAFARAVGMTESQADCVTRSAGPSPRGLTGMARADLYKDATGFRLLEWNLGSPLGGIECVDVCRALLAVPEMAAFLAREGLGFADTREAVLETLRSETGYPAGTNPVVAVVETPGAFPGAEALMCDKAARWAECGLPTVLTGHLGELARSNGRLCLRGEPVDVVYRFFTFEDMLVHVDDGLLEPLLSAAECGEVVIFTPLDAELYGSKGALALLSEPAGQSGLTPEERDACARLVPWTRRAQSGDAVLEDGCRVDLLAYAFEHQDDLVLKPSLSYGGKGVTVGADPDIAPAAWRNELAQAMNDSYVVQRLVRPVPELFPSGTPGCLAAWTVAWGAFMMQPGYAGMVTRAVPAEAGAGVVNFTKGAHVGCGFHAQA
jgi:hypothetical protein